MGMASAINHQMQNIGGLAERNHAGNSLPFHFCAFHYSHYMSPSKLLQHNKKFRTNRAYFHLSSDETQRFFFRDT
jgi:hypothetical protein